jgi:hypothetical protein
MNQQMTKSSTIILPTMMQMLPLKILIMGMMIMLYRMMCLMKRMGLPITGRTILSVTIREMFLKAMLVIILNQLLNLLLKEIVEIPLLMLNLVEPHLTREKE